MPIQLTPEPSFRAVLAESSRPRIGMWVCSGNALVAEVCAGSGLDWLLIDAEHSPNSLESILAQLQAIAAYPITPVVRAPSADAVTVKQLLDIGAQNLLIPMVNTAEAAREMAAAMLYPPAGIRGVGSALARSARWNRIDGYLAMAAELVSLFVQIETVQAVDNAAEIAAVDGVDGAFIGPSDLAASMGHLGQQGHPDVVAAVERAIRAVVAAGKPAGVNAFDPATARRYIEAGASFVLVGADLAILARASETLADDFIGDAMLTEQTGASLPEATQAATTRSSAPQRESY